MDYATYYRDFVSDCDRMGADEFCSPGNQDGWHAFTDHQLISAATSGTLGIGAVGHELSRRGLLDKVPGKHWN
jgi:hypothetical protein